jgi:ABC-type uncharacterized transport system permease subunit
VDPSPGFSRYLLVGPALRFMSISGITVTCFAASYGTALILEASRLWFRAQIRNALMLVFAAAGVVAHTIYLFSLAWSEAQRHVGVFSSWSDWCLLAAWVLAAAYIGLALRRPQNTVGIFLLPLVLGAVGIAQLSQGLEPFPRAQALGHWRWIHGLSLLIGTVAVVLGFATGVMYLVQSYRLKHKLPPRQGLRLPSLEWLQRFNREALWISTFLLAAGLLSGIVLNLTRDTAGVLWTDPVVISSGLLFLWLLLVMIFESFYRPARQGRKVAYLTMASFVFLGLALLFAFFGGHGGARQAPPDDRTKVSTAPTASMRIVRDHSPRGIAL